MASPSSTTAYGIWKLRQQRNAKMGSNWPTVAPPTVTASYLVIAGGGGGGASRGGGGGAGGYRQ